MQLRNGRMGSRKSFDALGRIISEGAPHDTLAGDEGEQGVTGLAQLRRSA
ncbi:MAG TPA: hypothetical protein VGF44_05130 [Terriglobales bacterium]